MTPDPELLQNYVRHGSQAAFAELVRRYVDLVYSAARRQIRDRQLAEDVTQAVFLVLSQKAKRLKPTVSLGGWLLLTTRYAAVDAMRTRMRQERRQRRAAKHELVQQPAMTEWEKIAGLLDEALASLSSTDRAIIVSRYFEERSLREVGQAMGLAEDTARKRLSRALTRLKRVLSRHDATITAGGLAAALTNQAVIAAPVALASKVVEGVSGGAASVAAAGTPFVIAKGALKTMTMIQVKKTLATMSVIAIATGLCMAISVQLPLLVSQAVSAAAVENNSDLELNASAKPVAHEIRTATLIGGSGMEQAQGVWVDQARSIYVCGLTTSPDFPGMPMDKPPAPVGKQDAFILKLDESGEKVLSAIRFGGSGQNWARSLVVDAKGFIYVTGVTDSVDFPADLRLPADAGEPTAPHVFVAKFSPEGKMVRAVSVGGQKPSQPERLLLNAEGQVCVAGVVRGRQAWPEGRKGHNDLLSDADNGFLLVFDNDLRELTYAATLSSAGNWAPDVTVSDIAEGPKGALVVAGTGMPQMSTTDGVLSPATDRTTGFVARFNPRADGKESLDWLTYVPASGSRVRALAVDKDGDITLGGEVFLPEGEVFPVKAPAAQPKRQRTKSGFVMKLSHDGKRQLSGSLMGGRGNDQVERILWGPDGTTYYLGQALSHDFPTLMPAQPFHGGQSRNGMPGGDLFIMRTDAADAVQFSSFFGGEGSELLGDAILTPGGELIAVGTAFPGQFAATAAAPMKRFTGFSKAFLVKLTPQAPAAHAE